MEASQLASNKAATSPTIRGRGVGSPTIPEREVEQEDPEDAKEEASIIFALQSPRAREHAELLSALQSVVLDPLVRQKLVREFRVLNETPHDFVCEASTFIVFELLVPCPWPVTDEDVQAWQTRFGRSVRLMAVPWKAPDIGPWDLWRRVRSSLSRAKLLGPASRRATRSGQWLLHPSCRQEELPRPRHFSSAERPPDLSVVDEVTGERHAIPEGATLLSPCLAQVLCRHLPVYLRCQSVWRLAYQPTVHGVSLQTLYRRVAGLGPSVLLVQDTEGRVFGGFASATWRAVGRYYGTNDSFALTLEQPQARPDVELITRLLARRDKEPQKGSGAATDLSSATACALEVLREPVKSATEALDLLMSDDDDPFGAEVKPQVSECEGERASDGRAGENPAAAEARAEQAAKGPVEALGLEPEARGPGEEALGLRVFGHVQGSNPFFLFSDFECLAMGGGSSFALYVDKDLLHGVSEPCSTFGSSVLASAVDFIITTMEVWVFEAEDGVSIPQW